MSALRRSPYTPRGLLAAVAVEPAASTPGPHSDPRGAGRVHRLVARCQAGDQAAFEPLLTTYRPLVHTLVRSTGQDEEWVEDTVVEVLLQLWRSLRSFAWKSAFSTWVYSLTMKVRAAELRRDSRRKAPSRALAGSQTAADDPESLAIARDQQECVLWQVAGLPSKYRTAVVLRYFRGCSYAEMAQALGVPMGTAKTWVFQGTRRVREALGRAAGGGAGTSAVG